MHWILFVGLAMTSDVKMGAFETKKECEEAANRFLDVFEDAGTYTMCLEKEKAEQLIKLNSIKGTHAAAPTGSAR